MAEQSYDLYGDLEEFELQQVVREKNDAHKKLEEKYDLAIQTIKNLHNDVKIWKKKCNNIEKSFWSLLETSKAEIKRKDSQLDALRRQRDDIAFRRGKHIKNNIETHKNSDQGNSTNVHVNPFRKEIFNIEIPSTSQQIEQAEDLRSQILKKTTSEYSKRKNDNKPIKLVDNEYDNNDTNKEYKISEKNYSRDSNSTRMLNRHSTDRRHEKEETSANRNDIKNVVNNNGDRKNQLIENIDRNQYNDLGKVITQCSPETNYKKDNRSNNEKESYPRPCKNREIIGQTENKERTNAANCESSSKRICKLSEKITANNNRESIKLTVTIGNSNANDEKPKEYPIPKSTIDIKGDKNQILNTIPKICEESVAAKNLISELMKDLKKLSNNNVTPPKKTKDTKSFEDVLFDNMVCGDEALSVLDENSKLNHKEMKNNELKCDQVQIDNKAISKNVHRSLLQESIPLESYEIPLENSFTSDPKLTMDDTPLIRDDDITEPAIDKNLNTNNDYSKDLFEESLNGLIKTNNQLENKYIECPLVKVIPAPIKLFGSDPKTPIKNTIEISEQNNLIQQNPLNVSATKFYELYLESPIKEIRDINEKNSSGINDDDIQTISDDENQLNNNSVNKEYENQQNLNKIKSNRKLIVAKNRCKENKFEGLQEILKTTAELNSPNKSDNNLEIRNDKLPNEDMKNNKQFKNNLDKSSEKEQTEELILDSKESENDSEVADIIQNNKIILNEDNDEIEMLNFNQNSNSIITPISISPNQQETNEATKYLTEILQKTNSPTKNSPLKIKMKLLFGETPEGRYKIITSPTSPTAPPATPEKIKDDIVKTVKTNNKIDIDNFCTEIVENEYSNKKIENNEEKNVSSLVTKESKIVMNKKIRANEKNIKGRKNKRKAEEISSNLPIKKLKTDLFNTEKNIENCEVPNELNTKKSLRNNKNLNSNLNSNKTIKCCENTDNLHQKLNSSVQSESTSEIVTMESIGVEDKKISLNQNIDYNLINKNCLEKSNENIDKTSNLESFTNRENTLETTKINDDITESVVLNLNITRRKRKISKKNSNTSKYNNTAEQHDNSKPYLNTKENIVTNNLVSIDPNMGQKEIPNIPQTSSIEEHVKFMKNYKIPKLNKNPSKNKNSTCLTKKDNIMKSFKIPKLNKNSILKQDKIEEINITENALTEENSQIQNKTKNNTKLKLSNNENLQILSPEQSMPENIDKTDCIINKKFENENTSTPKQINLLRTTTNVLSKNDEELFDCIFKSPLQISGGNNSPQLLLPCEQENSEGNSENLKFNQIEDDFRKLFGKSPQTTSSLLSPLINNDNDNCLTVNNNKLQKIETLSNSQIADVSLNTMLCSGIDKDDLENSTTINNNTSSSCTTESSIIRKQFATSGKEYKMVYDTNEGITTWVINTKKIKRKKKRIT